jgi:hypothetical protein
MNWFVFPMPRFLIRVRSRKFAVKLVLPLLWPVAYGLQPKPYGTIPLTPVSLSPPGMEAVNVLAKA